MKRLLIIAFAALAVTGCGASMRLHRNSNPYEKPLFVQRYLVRGNPLDDQIASTIDQLRANPRSAALHNQFGELLGQKGFPKDAETEFERAVAADRHFYPAWYNLALMRSARSDYAGARIAFNRVLRYKPGHSAALFQMGLMEERRGDQDAAIDDYAKAFSINKALLDVRVNPQILDSRLVAYALIKAYPNQHDREALLFQGTPPGYVEAAPPAPKIAPAASAVPATPPAKKQ